MQIGNQVSEIQVSYTRKKTEECKLVTCSEDVFDVLIDLWEDETIAYQESFLVLLLDRGKRILGYRWISKGGTSSTVVDAKHIFGIALKCNASGIIIAHNHPSGQRRPSQADLTLTSKLHKAGKLLDIMLLDHIIVTPDLLYYSFADEGVL